MARSRGLTLSAAGEQIRQCSGAGGNAYRSSDVKAWQGSQLTLGVRLRDTSREERVIVKSASCIALCSVFVVSVASTPVEAQPLPTESVSEASAGRVMLGSTVGLLVGLAAGVAAGYAVEQDSGESWVGAGEWWIGGLIGSSLGAATGAHIANGFRGSLPLGVLGTLVVAPAVGLIAVPLTGGGAIIAIPAAQIGVSVMIERRTGRDDGEAMIDGRS